MGAAIRNIPLSDISGHSRTLGDFAGKVLLVVNVASKCGLTPQYTALEQLYRDKKGRGLEVLGFPANDFAGQEPGTEAEIADFCSTNYDVTFPLFAKIEVNGAGTHPLYLWLKGEKAGVFGTEAIKWNFTKFLIDRSGQVVKRFAPADSPEKIDKLVGEVLAAPARS